MRRDGMDYSANEPVFEGQTSFDGFKLTLNSSRVGNESVVTKVLAENTVPPRLRKATVSKPFHRNGDLYTSEETNALRQRQMDDLVYLSKQKFCHPVHAKYEGIFMPEGGLNMELAETFVNESAWSIEQKATKLLKLDEFEQFQCGTLSSKKIDDKWRRSIKYAKNVETKLYALAEQDYQFRQHIDEFTKLAQTVYICNGWDPKTLPLVLSWLTGKKPISRQAIDAKIKRLDKRLE
jgi:hypothetical protein